MRKDGDDEEAKEVLIEENLTVWRGGQWEQSDVLQEEEAAAIWHRPTIDLLVKTARGTNLQYFRPTIDQLVTTTCGGPAASKVSELDTQSLKGLQFVRWPDGHSSPQ